MRTMTIHNKHSPLFIMDSPMVCFDTRSSSFLKHFKPIKYKLIIGIVKTATEVEVRAIQNHKVIE